MAHPQHFDDNDPILAQLRQLCLALPGTDEKVSHGRPAFFTKKIFAMYGAVVKGEHHAGDHDNALVFLPTEDEAVALDQDDRFFVPAYWGPYGWRGTDLGIAADGGIDWDEAAELIEESFRSTATKKLVGELDAQKDL